MQLSSRILTALAVLILAVTVVAVRAGSTDTVDAATGTINAVNVGTCYTTDDAVFTVADCNDGDDNTGPNEGYEVAGRDSITEVGTVYATYAHDPKTAPDNPRAILENSNVIKISIKDTGRDKRTPVLLGAGNVAPCDTTEELNSQTPRTNPCGAGGNTTDGEADFDSHLLTIQKDYPDIKADFAKTLEGTGDAEDFRWNNRQTTGNALDDRCQPQWERGQDRFQHPQEPLHAGRHGSSVQTHVRRRRY